MPPRIFLGNYSVMKSLRQAILVLCCLLCLTACNNDEQLHDTTQLAQNAEQASTHSSRVLIVAINGSFVNSAKIAGLTNNQIHRICSLFRGRIDFRRDLQSGDSFRVLFDKGHNVYAAKILAVSFNVNGRDVSEYRSADGHFYNELSGNKYLGGRDKRQFLAKMREYKRLMNNADLDNNRNNQLTDFLKVSLASVLMILLIWLVYPKKQHKKPNNSKKKAEPIVNKKTNKVEHSDVMVDLAKEMAVRYEDFYYINFRAESSDGTRDFLVARGEKFDFRTLRHPYISTIFHCDNLVVHLCNLITMAIHSIHNVESEGLDFLNMLFTFDNSGACGLYSGADARFHDKTLMGEIAAGKVNWGVFNDMIPNDSDDDPSFRYIKTTVIHALFGIDFITMVKLPNARGDAYHVDFNRTYVSGFYSPFSKNRSVVKIDYIDANGVKTERNIIEAEHVVKDGVHYLKGFCLLRFAERLFRFDRIILPDCYRSSGSCRVFFDSVRDGFFTENNLTHLIPAYQMNKTLSR